MRNRKRNRLQGYDYSQPGLYFVTICCQDNVCWFGNVVNDKMVLNKVGEIVRKEWGNNSKIRENVSLGAFQVMPNHIHGIIEIKYKMQGSGVLQYATTEKSPGIPHLKSPSNNLGAIVRGFKGTTTKQINELNISLGMAIWQRN